MDKKHRIIKYLPFAVFIILMLILHMTFKLSDDDVYLIQNTLKSSIWEEFGTVIYNFTSWSSRVLVNLPIHIILHLDYRVWLFIEMFMWLTIAAGLSYIFIDNCETRKNIILVSLILMFPFNYVTSAGWITTTMTYIWPLAAGIFALTSTRMWKDGKKFKWYHVALYALITLYGANQEEMSVFLTLCFGAFAIYTVYKKKSSAVIIMQACISVFNLCFHALTPGNAARAAHESAVYFTDYNTLSLIDKLELGFSSTLYRFVFKSDYIFFFMTLFILIAVCQKQKKLIFRLMGAVPFAMYMFFGYFIGHILEDKNLIFIFQQRLLSRGIITEDNYYNLKDYIPLAILFFMGIMLIVSFYLIFGESFKSIIATVMLFGGLGGRMVVAFSTTVWASTDRPYTIMYFTFIMLALFVLNEIDFVKLKIFKWIIPAFAAVTGVYNFYCLFMLLY